jgi:hypothetical protein
VQTLESALITNSDVKAALGVDLWEQDGGGTLIGESANEADADCYRGLSQPQPVNSVQAAYETGPLNFEGVGNDISQYRTVEEAETAVETLRAATLRCGFTEGDATPVPAAHATFRLRHPGDLQEGIAIDSGQPPYDVVVSRRSNVVALIAVMTKSGRQQVGAEDLSARTMQRLEAGGVK